MFGFILGVQTLQIGDSGQFSVDITGFTALERKALSV
jgi:hypothetical protein